MKEINYTADSVMQGEYPRIKKLGACSPYGEMTPFVFHGRLMRLELCDSARGTAVFSEKEDICGIIRDVETGEILSRLAYGCYYQSGYLEDETFYVVGVATDPEARARGQIKIYESQNLVDWSERVLLEKPGWEFYNTSLVKGDNGYVLCVEVGKSSEDDIGVPFTCYFATSPDMKTWTFMPYDRAYPKDRYCGGPCMKYHNGYYYLFLVTALPCARYTNYLVRTRSFEEWEIGYYNPVLMPSPEDRMLSSRAVDMADAGEFMKTMFNINNSDIDLCDWQGKTYINYCVGNQLGKYYICEAEYDGSMGDFLEGYFR